MLKAIKIRLYPTETQQTTINKLLGCCRLVLQLSDREWVCPECGVIHDRDINAAKNILNEGKRIIGSSSPEFKRVGEQALASSMNLEKNVK